MCIDIFSYIYLFTYHSSILYIDWGHWLVLFVSEALLIDQYSRISVDPGTNSWYGEDGDRFRRIQAVAGLESGEYVALAVAGAFSFEAGLELVAARGRAMKEVAEAVTDQAQVNFLL